MVPPTLSTATPPLFVPSTTQPTPPTHYPPPPPAAPPPLLPASAACAVSTAPQPGRAASSATAPAAASPTQPLGILGHHTLPTYHRAPVSAAAAMPLSHAGETRNNTIVKSAEGKTGVRRNDSIASLAALAGSIAEQRMLHDGDKGADQSARPRIASVIGTTAAGEARVVPVTPESTTVVMSSFGLVSVDLREINNLVDEDSQADIALREISIASNSLRSIDLSPLARCPNLAILILSGNGLESIDLAPLARCKSLERLWLHNNSLKSLDLRPLNSCPLLRSLYLDSNKIDEVSIDLAPLAACGLLRSLRLGGNKLNGRLDVSPLLSCLSLSSLVYPAGVHLVATVPGSNTGGGALPPALRKRAELIEWIDEADSEPDIVASQQDNLSDTEYEALLLNFRMRDFYKTRDLLKKAGRLNSTGVADILYEKDGLDQYAVVIIQISTTFTGEKAVVEIRSISKDIPIVVVGNKDLAEAGSACIRRGAQRFLSEPLRDRDAFAVRHLVQQSFRDLSSSTKSVDSTSDPKSVPDTVPRDKVLLKVPTQKRLRPTAPQAAGVGSAVRNRMERSALDKLFARGGGSVDLDHFTPMTTLCGIPSCASALLFRACLQYSDMPMNGPLTLAGFAKFWEDRLQNCDAEGRLYHVLIQPGDKFVGTGAIDLLTDGLMKTLRSRIPEALDTRETISACLLYGISGSENRRRPLSETQLRKARLCSRLLACESGVCEGVTEFLRADTFSTIRSNFLACHAKAATLRNGCLGHSRDEVTYAEMVEFCKERALLLPRAVEAVFGEHGFSKKCKTNALRLPSFACCWLAMSNVKTLAATQYWFAVLDRDMDGHISATDAAHYYLEKEKLLKDDGLILAQFWDIWTCVLDLCQPLDARRGPTMAELMSLKDKNRMFVVQALLFRDDGNAVIDIRRTMELGVEGEYASM